MNLKDKIVVITGGSKGFGRNIADVFLARGAKVVVSSHENEAQSDIENLMIVQSDVRKEEEVKNLGNFVLEKFGHIDIWINNAGIWYPQMPIEDLDMDKVHNVFETNVFGTMYGSIAATKVMKKQGQGIIINIISAAALSGRANISAYSASKFAADGFTKSLRLELEESGVKVVSIYPHGMKTALFNEAKPEDWDEYMDPKEVAEKVVNNLESENIELEQVFRREE